MERRPILQGLPLFSPGRAQGPRSYKTGSRYFLFFTLLGYASLIKAN